MLPIVSAPLITEGEKLKKSFAITDSKLSSVNKNLNGLALGLTTAAGAGTMFGGKIGDLVATMATLDLVIPDIDR